MEPTIAVSNLAKRNALDGVVCAQNKHILMNFKI